MIILGGERIKFSQKNLENEETNEKLTIFLYLILCMNIFTGIIANCS